mmetsp:Transcript_5665/g.17415  ORF Transcript_5665/g.17415 Transcript_5665/m.17415 type:complete len:87 (+) Transcript_5665:2463-2723(+)
MRSNRIVCAESTFQCYADLLSAKPFECLLTAGDGGRLIRDLIGRLLPAHVPTFCLRATMGATSPPCVCVCVATICVTSPVCVRFLL